MKKYLKLLVDNRKSSLSKPLTLSKNMSGDEVTLYIYDIIVSDEYMAEWMGGISPESFVKTLSEIEAKKIHLRINSPGGDVFAARAIEQALREHPATVVAHIDGYAASAASFIAMAADEVEMSPGAFFMIHKAWTGAAGNSDELLSVAALLEKIDGSLVKTYATRTSQSEESIEKWMTAETWFSAEESVELGFADRIASNSKKDSETTENQLQSYSSHWNLSVYKNAPNCDQLPSKTPTENQTIKTQNYLNHLRRQLRLIEKAA